ncbi:MAG: hypothetical protein KatS3mg065_1132 [Chloroflexota bacterium]|nr:MAG: hypothetical protein KatS3mg065_1132 [Chloroflexota bacterium]
MTMSQNLARLMKLLAEMFQLDQAELDFGIYRIMNAKREEITRFLDNDLLPQVREALSTYELESRAILEAELEKAKEQAKALGFDDPAQAPKVKELQARYNAAFDIEAAENEVFSHLYNFFRRYYSDGDFISQRRYKEGVYAIPYEGEEVKLYWANHDQYYIKTSEYLRNYTFKLPSGRRVHFKLVEADTEKDNNRPASASERRFILSAEEPLVEENGELVIRFEYRPHPDKAKQADLNAAAADRILNKTTRFDDWRRDLAAPRPTEKNPNRTLLEKHLTDYTARNTFDYFIHKDLGGFLAARTGLLHQERGDAPRRHRERDRAARGAVPFEDQGHPPDRPQDHRLPGTDRELPEEALAQEEVRRGDAVLHHARPHLRHRGRADARLVAGSDHQERRPAGGVGAAVRH